MSSFKTYSSDNKSIYLFFRYSRILNILLLIIVNMFVGFFNTRIIHAVFASILIILFVTFIIVFERYMRRIKSNGTLELTKSNLKWRTENYDLGIDKEEIDKIIIRKEFLRSFFSQDFKYVLFDIICKNKSLIHLIVNKYSNDKQEYDIIESLILFSKINGITLEKKKNMFGS